MTSMVTPPPTLTLPPAPKLAPEVEKEGGAEKEREKGEEEEEEEDERGSEEEELEEEERMEEEEEEEEEKEEEEEEEEEEGRVLDADGCFGCWFEGDGGKDFSPTRRPSRLRWLRKALTESRTTSESPPCVAKANTAVSIFATSKM